MILTVVIGMCLATPGWVARDILFFGNLGIALCAGSAAVINHVVDRRIDTVMARTMKRPVATGKVEPLNALLFALAIGVAGMGILLTLVNALTAWLTLASLLGYAVVYTLFLKRATPQNIVIGGIAGAAPPLLGWTAVTGEFHGNALLLVLIIFAWTPPHFWALAIHRKEEYAKADVPMLPVTHGEAYTKLHILLYNRHPSSGKSDAMDDRHERDDLSRERFSAGAAFSLLGCGSAAGIPPSCCYQNVSLLHHLSDVVVCGFAGRSLPLPGLGGVPN